MLSRAEREELEMQKMPKFKARPVNQEVLNGNMSHTFRAPERPSVTRPQPFSFATDYRVKEPQQSMENSFSSMKSSNSSFRATSSSMKVTRYH